METALQIAPSLGARYPGANIGVLLMRNVANSHGPDNLTEQADGLIHSLRSTYAAMDRSSLRSLPTIAAYEAYYRSFKKTYHVRLQLESVIGKGKSLPPAGVLVRAMFMSELKNQLLTAGHDASALEFPLTASVAEGDERYTLLSGSAQVCKVGDMMISDGNGVISSIVYGPDHRTRLMSGTTNACYTVYGVPGISSDTVRAHLCDLRDLLMLAAPAATVEELSVHVVSAA